MEKKHTVLDFLGQVFMIYGITLLLLNIFTLIFGADAKELSTIFSLGNDGLSAATSFQFLLAAALITGLRFLFFTETVIKNMAVTVRIILMSACILAIAIGFILICGWFPADNITAWILFIACFVISCGATALISSIKEKQENKALEEALQKVKEEL